MNRSINAYTQTVVTSTHEAFPLEVGLDQLLDILKTIFSWAVLMPIAVIISGILLAKPFKLQVETEQRFRIPIPRIFHLEATNGEVILGFAGFIITLVIIALVGGQAAYAFFRNQFGIDPGQFNSLCVLSSFVTVIWSVIIWLLTQVRSNAPDPVERKRDSQIIRISNKLKQEDEQ